ncbi:DUF4340 domain-containing protein [Pelagicoccus sp. SDUM812003]|uniref:DUF4340 domain-containing protein n=1 Tax=Pelagicoccus sp. SDUM812003 TaxID=3041267 RepID=UPI00280D3E2D|nr:DUF4340 domain-containing protein [Pelagicoccus sp. SDUM812003]MDQ8205167.1 DUF4340 domain-containing protein [Pelagicoccus sp. SDUM812003]
MNLKKLSLSTCVLAILAIVTYFVKNGDTSMPEDPRIGQGLVDLDTLPKTKSIEIKADDNQFELVMSSKESSWIMPDLHSLPVNMDTLGRFVTRLTDARLERIASRKPERIAELGFGSKSVAFKDENGSVLVSVKLGRETDTGKQIVKYGDEDLAFIADDQFSLNSDPLSWLDKSLLTIDRDAIRSARIELPNGESLSVARDSAEADWTTDDSLPEGKRLDQGAITRALNRFANVSFTQLAELDSDVVSDAAANSASFEITMDDEKSYSISIGRRPEVKTTKEVETENENGETVTETQEEVETPAGPVIIKIESSDGSDPINEYMDETAFEVASYLFSNVPQSLDSLLEDEPETEVDAADSSGENDETPRSDAD